MKIAIALYAALAASLVSAPIAASAADFAGTWKVDGSEKQPGSTFVIAAVCQFQQAGVVLTGTCKGPNGIGPASGKLVGPTKVEWECNVTPTDRVGFRGLIKLAGVMGADGVVRGEFSLSTAPALRGTFTQVRP